MACQGVSPRFEHVCTHPPPTPLDDASAHSRVGLCSLWMTAGPVLVCAYMSREASGENPTKPIPSRLQSPDPRCLPNRSPPADIFTARSARNPSRHKLQLPLLPSLFCCPPSTRSRPYLRPACGRHSPVRHPVESSGGEEHLPQHHGISMTTLSCRRR